MEHMNNLSKRDGYCYDRYGNVYRCNTAWNTWGRWVALGAIIFAGLLFFYLCSCFTARRRRKAGRQPYYGTGWAGNTPFGHGQAQYNPNYQTQARPQNENFSAPPPQYGQPQQQTYGGGEAQGYYGGGRDVELQQPNHTYQQGGQNVYEAPVGPPPKKV